MSPLPALPRSYSRVTLRERPRASIDPKLDGTGTFQYEKDVQLWSADQLKAGEAVVKVEWVSRSGRHVSLSLGLGCTHAPFRSVQVSIDPAMRGKSLCMLNVVKQS